jgi:hypothetical protein
MHLRRFINVETFLNPVQQELFFVGEVVSFVVLPEVQASPSVRPRVHCLLKHHP